MNTGPKYACCAYRCLMLALCHPGFYIWCLRPPSKHYLACQKVGDLRRACTQLQVETFCSDLYPFLGVYAVFAPVSTIPDLWKYQAMFIAIQIAGLAMGVYKCSTMGLVPTKVLLTFIVHLFFFPTFSPYAWEEFISVRRLRTGWPCWTSKACVNLHNAMYMYLYICLSVRMLCMTDCGVHDMLGSACWEGVNKRSKTSTFQTLADLFVVSCS